MTRTKARVPATRGAFVRPVLAARVGRERAGYDESAARDWGVTVGEYRAAVRAHLRRLVDGVEIAHRTTEAALRSILATGRVLPGPEAIGAAPDRVWVRASDDSEWVRPADAGEAADYFRDRDAPVYTSGSPIYGYLTGREEATAAVGLYGSARLTLHRRVHARTTITVGDSWTYDYLVDTEGRPLVVPAPLSRPELSCCHPHLAPLLRRHAAPLPEPGLDTYLESQTHGPVTVADIARVDFSEQPAGDLLEVLESAGVPFGFAAGGEPAPLLASFAGLAALCAQLPAAASTLHGDAHWRRVATAGLELAPAAGADALVVLLFALLHDAFRVSDGDDAEHGPAAAGFAASNAGTLGLEPGRLAVLAEALAVHSDGGTSRDPTVGACLDADRLDLGRVGVRVDPAYLSTAAARDMAAGWRPHAAPGWRALYLAAAEAESLRRKEDDRA